MAGISPRHSQQQLAQKIIVGVVPNKKQISLRQHFGYYQDLYEY